MPRDHTFKVLIAEDEPIILEHIAEKIEQIDPSFQVIATAMNGEDALELVKTYQPDVLFTDVKMPLMDGIELTRQVKKLFPEVHIVILSGFDNFSFAQQALKLGVFDYLLKPMTGESLQDTLDEIKIKLEQRNMIQERNIITQDLNGLGPSLSVPSTLENSKLMLYLICLGNLNRHAMNEIDVHHINRIWDMVEWTKFINEHLASAAKWWVIDDKSCNVKFLIMTWNPHEATTNRTIEIQNGITAFIQYGIPVTLCTHNEPVRFSDLWETAQELRKSLNKGLIPCQSSIILTHDTEPLQRRISHLDPVTTSTMERFVEQRKFDPLIQELSRLFEVWKPQKFTQDLLERSLIQLARLLFEPQDDQPKQTMVAIESGIYHIVAAAKDIDELYQDVLRLLIHHLPTQRKLDSAEELYTMLEDYIRLNFTKAINVDHLAHKFQFNASYIIRVFKKYKGIPPLQYLISLRIQEAKRLIEHNPDMDFKDISEIIGYTDQHYFSRVFRNWTGLNPSEYWDSIHKKG
ncbi:response regulator [Paenibacillus sp. GCM10027629]|uniref:response regulator transcription factor n=1 Tax=Paenibacillus sp. GCM10027629 TaxID=3273414 RepID=UPI00363030B7